MVKNMVAFQAENLMKFLKFWIRGNGLKVYEGYRK